MRPIGSRSGQTFLLAAVAVKVDISLIDMAEKLATEYEPAPLRALFGAASIVTT